MNEQICLDKICGRVQNRSCRQAIWRELTDHLEDSAADFMAQGYSEEEAKELAADSMGDPGEISDLFNQVHKPVLEWGQILGILIFTTLIRSVMPQLLELLTTNTDGTTAFAPERIQGVLWVLGIVLYLYAMGISALEKYHDMPFWYGRSQSGGSNANGAIIVSIAISVWVLPPLQTAVVVLITIAFHIGIRSQVERSRIRKEQAYLFCQGKTLTPLGFGGYAEFAGKKTKVVAKEEISAGTEVIAVGIDGFKILVEPLSRDKQILPGRTAPTERTACR